MATTTLPVLRHVSSDDALARRIADGDEIAFSILYQRYRVRIERYCRSIVRHDEDALDAAQNTLVKALIAIRAGRQAPTVVPWLFHIARNEAITVLRGRRPQSELFNSLPDCRHEPAREALVREELRATIDSVRALSDRSREALILREVGGLRYEQVAQALGLTPGAARQAVHEARRALAADRDGRDEDCAVIRTALGDRDGRRRNTRTVRAHLRGCGACRAWRDDHVTVTGRRLAALPGASVSTAGGVSSWLAGLLGGSTTAGTGAAVGGTIGVNVKVLASLAVLAVGVAPATEREIAKPLAAKRTAPAPVHHHHAQPAAVVSLAKPAAGAAAHVAPVVRSTAPRMHLVVVQRHVEERHVVVGRAAQHHDSQQQGGDDTQRPRHDARQQRDHQQGQRTEENGFDRPQRQQQRDAAPQQAPP